MPISGIRKAATLLINLDAATAAELLRSTGPETIADIATELASLAESAESQPADAGVQEFFGMLREGGRARGTEGFVKEVLDGALGEQRSQEVLRQVNERIRARDPFRQIRLAEAQQIARALEGESAHVVSVVLTELPPKKSAELLPLLDESVRAETIRCMAGGQDISREAKNRIAAVVQNRLEQARRQEASGEAPTGGREQLRKVAVLLRGLEVDLRDGMLSSLAEQDSEAAENIKNLMVTWDDIVHVADRSLQEALRSAEAGKLALALVEAETQTTDKIRRNISERAKAMLEEEASLLSSPKRDEIEQAREEILTALREMNAKGELQFQEN